MSLMTQLSVVAFLTVAVGQGAPSLTNRDSTPTSEPCPMTFSIGHVPGHMDAVWELSCRSRTEG